MSPFRGEEDHAATEARAWDYFREGDMRRALEEFERWTEERSDSAQGWFGRGWCGVTVLSGDEVDLSEVRALYAPSLERALALHAISNELSAPQVAGAHLQLGMLEDFGGSREKAIGHYRAAIDAAPSSPTAVATRCELARLVADDDVAFAQRLLEEALEIDPEHPRALDMLRRLQRSGEEFEILLRVMPIFRQVAVRVHPDDTLKEVAVRGVPTLEAPGTSGWFMYSGDRALPADLDSGLRDPDSTVREVGIQPHDTLIYFQLTTRPGQDPAERFIKRWQSCQAEGDRSGADEQLRFALLSVDRHMEDRELEEADAILDGVLQVAPDNGDAKALRRRLEEVIRVRDAGSSAADCGAWRQGKGGPARTGQSASTLRPPLDPAWEIDTRHAPSQLVVAGGCVYFASLDVLRGLDAGTGDEKWRNQSPTRFGAALVAGSEGLYATERDRLTCLDFATGRELWNCPVEQPGSVILVGTDLYCADGAGSLLRFDSRNGRLLGNLATDGHPIHGLASDGTVIVATSPDVVIAVEPELGSVRWRREGRFDEVVPVCAYEHAYLGTVSEGFWCLERQTGRCRWMFGDATRFKAAPAVGLGRVFVGDARGQFGCLEAWSGELLWTPKEWLADRASCSASPVLAGTFVYVFLDDGTLRCLDAYSGGEVWRTRLGEARGEASALAVADDALHHSTQAGRIGCLARRGTAPRSRGVTPSASRRTPAAERRGDIGIRMLDGKSSLSREEDSSLQQALYRIFQDRIDEAIAILEKLQQDHPDEKLVLGNLALAYEKRGLVGRAIGTWEHVLDVDRGTCTPSAVSAGC